MLRSRAAWLSALVTASVLGLGLAVRRDLRVEPAPHVASSASPGRSRVKLAGRDRDSAPPRPHPARWLAFGGGAEPSSNQVSMENDLALASEVLGPGGVLLFAGGPGTEGVYELADGPPPDELADELSDLVAPHGGRDARYRKTRLHPHGPATRDAIRAALAEELAEPGEPLVVYVDCHGDGGVAVLDNSLATWGGDALTVKDVVALLDDAKRPVRFLVSACFSGGLAEMAFRGAKVDGGVTDKDRCGLFASTWDLEATGCDPDPERQNHEGYAVHLLHALRGKDRNGKSVRVDLDGDGSISLLEAHTRARIASEGLDVPTTTSERFLRAVAPNRGPGSALSLPEEDATIDALKAKLGMLGDDATIEADARRRLDELETRHSTLADLEQRVSEELETARHAVKAELFARWPSLEDPWRPEFAAVLAREREAIDRFLDESRDYAEFLKLRDRADKATNDALDAALERAPVERLVRAIDNRLLAGRLKKRGGKDWDGYEKLLRCERSRLR